MAPAGAAWAAVDPVEAAWAAVDPVEAAWAAVVAPARAQGIPPAMLLHH